MNELTFTAFGTPQPQGSAKGFAFRRKNGTTGVAITSDNAKLKPYRHTLTQVALMELQRNDLVAPLCARVVPVEVTIVWTLAKPKSTPKRVTSPTKKPDADKLLRAVLDSLTGIAYEDDAQVVRVIAEKQYGSPESTVVMVRAVA